MRRILGLTLAGVAGFFLCTMVLLLAYAPGKVKVTPLTINSTTHLEGTARALPTGGTGPIKAVNRTVVDGEASDDDVAVFDAFTCLIKGSDGPDCVDDKDPDKRLISASTERYATDRSTAMAVADEKYTDADDKREGLISKIPFDAEKKNYPIWESIIGKPVDLVFEGEEEIEGLNTYRFSINVPATKAEIAKGVQGTYADQKTTWYDPVTGSPIKQTEKQTRKLENGTAVLDIDLAYTDEQVSNNVEAAKANISRLGLISKGPLFAGILGLLALAGAAFALMGGRRGEEELVYDDGYDDGRADTAIFGDVDEKTTRRRGDLHN